MSKSKYLANQTLLTVLWDRLPSFTQDEWIILMKILAQHQPEIMKFIHSYSPQVYGWIEEKHQQLEEQKTDREIEELKKSLQDKK